MENNVYINNNCFSGVYFPLDVVNSYTYGNVLIYNDDNVKVLVSRKFEDKTPIQ
ncbi:hypothetical protein IKI14_03360 [bacterium]|nr:hypothetical protein [bacterium]